MLKEKFAQLTGFSTNSSAIESVVKKTKSKSKSFIAGVVAGSMVTAPALYLRLENSGEMQRAAYAKTLQAETEMVENSQKTLDKVAENMQTQERSCVDPLTHKKRLESDTVHFDHNIFHRYHRDDNPRLCINGEGFKVDMKRIEPKDAYTWSKRRAGRFWERNYHSNDNDIDLEIRYPIVENVGLYNSGQGVIFREQTKYFAIRDVYIQHAGDDAIESDHLVGGVIKDVLIDKAFMGLAWDMHNAPCRKTANNVVKVDNSIIRVFPQYGMYPGWTDKTLPGYGAVFKWEKDCRYATKLELRNTIIVANQEGNSDTENSLNLNAHGNLTVSKNNTLVWLGKEPYKGKVPDGFTVTTDPKVFTDAWHQWFKDHPQFVKPRRGPDMNYDLPPLG